MKQAPGKILVVKLRYIGDVVLSTPVLTRLRENYPKAQISMLVNAGTEGVVEGHPAVDEILVVERRGWMSDWKLWRELRRRRFDLVVDLTDGDRAAILSWLTRAPMRIGFNSENHWRGRLYSRIVRADRHGMHTVMYHLAVTDVLGLSGSPPRPSISVGSDARQHVEQLMASVGVEPGRPLVCLHPGARWWFKAWPPERFAALADRIHAETEAQALFLGGSQDHAAVQQIATAMKTSFRSVAGKTPLRDLAAVLERATLMVTNDNGPMHLAAAVGTPIVGLFGPSDPRVWGPWGEGHRTFYKQLDCRACFHPDCFRGDENCMRLISLEEVWAAVQQELTCVRR
jgi:predicted lipopolysaccharide heptosyltransferase III